MPSASQQKGYRSNARAKKWLLDRGYTHIYLKPHMRYDKDIYGLFDGFCFSPEGDFTFLQIKSNAYPPSKPIIEFLEQKNICALAINVKDGGKIAHRVY